MDTKSVKIIEAAWKLFLRHGFRKVTMGEIAEASGFSRPTLYAVFPNKEKLIDALAREAWAGKKGETDKALASEKSLKQKLGKVFRIWVIDDYLTNIQHEKFEELNATIQNFAPQAVDDFYKDFETYLTALLRPYLTKDSKLSASQLGKIASMATRGFKAASKNGNDLKQLVDGLILMLLEVAGE